MRMRGFIGGSNRSVSPFADQERAMNLYVAPTESRTAPTQAALYQRPGVKVLWAGSAVHGGKGRGSFSQEFASVTVNLFVVGPLLFRADRLGIVSLVSLVVDDGRPVTFSSSGETGDEVLVTSGRSGYIYTISTGAFGLVPFLTGKADVGTYLEGRFLVMDTRTSTVYVSDLLDGLTWDPTNLIQRTQASDPWVGMIAWNKYLYLIGSLTTEPWYNAGTFPIPFAPVPSTLIQWGTTATFSVCGVGQSVMFLGQSVNGYGNVISISGVSAENVETSAVAAAMEKIFSPTDAIGFAYDLNGHTFYNLTFILGDQTWVYDQTANIWTENGTFVDGEYHAWRVAWPVPTFGQMRCLDLSGLGLYELSDAYFVDPGGSPIRWERQPPAQFKENKRIFFKSVELFTESGLADLSGQGSNPQVMMQMSNDGGKTFGSELLAGVGLRGEYGRRTRWDRCGMGRNKVFRFAGTDPIAWRLVDCFMELEEGADFQ